VVREETTRTLEDVLSRRTRALFLNARGGSHGAARCLAANLADIVCGLTMRCKDSMSSQRSMHCKRPQRNWQSSNNVADRNPSGRFLEFAAGAEGLVPLLSMQSATANQMMQLV
jgi:hypothetical protein